MLKRLHDKKTTFYRLNLILAGWYKERYIDLLFSQEKQLLDRRKESNMRDLKELVAKIRELPDNPNLKHLDSNCYTIKIKELSKHHILSATYYDFKFQYSIIIQIIESEPIETSAKHIDTILKNPHRITYKGASIKFHPDVVKNLKSIVWA